MPRRLLGTLRNLGQYAIQNTSKWTKRKRGPGDKENISHDGYNLLPVRKRARLTPSSLTITPDLPSLAVAPDPPSDLEEARPQVHAPSPIAIEDPLAPATFSEDPLVPITVDVTAEPFPSDSQITFDTPETPNTIEDSCNNIPYDSNNSNLFAYTPSHQQSPTIPAALAALHDIEATLKPPRKKGGYKDVHINSFTRERMETMRTFLSHYTNGSSDVCGQWIAASRRTSTGMSKHDWFARNLCLLTKKYVKDRGCLPANPYGVWNESLLDDEDFVSELTLHLQSVGKYVCAADIISYLAQLEVKERLGLERPVCLTTAKRWMDQLGYRWKWTFKGTYIDGHKHEDVMDYCQNIYLPIGQRLRHTPASGTTMVWRLKMSLCLTRALPTNLLLSGIMTSQPFMPMIGELLVGYTARKIQHPMPRVRVLP